jgi:amidase
VVEAAIGRAQAVEPRLNFMVTELFERRARVKWPQGRLQGRFGGVPFLVKDLDDIAACPRPPAPG